MFEQCGGGIAPTQSLREHRETRLAAELVYHGLTTGAGVQTLGEEYCDILQVTGVLQFGVTPGFVGCDCRVLFLITYLSGLNVGPRPQCIAWCAAGPVGVAPGRAQRTLLVLLQTLVPYLAQRVAAATAAAALQAEGERQAAAAQGSTPDPALLATAAERRQDAAHTGFSDSVADGPEPTDRPGAAQDSSGAPTGAWAAAMESRVHRASVLGSRVSTAAAAEARRAWAALSGYAPEAVRLHLALFYFFGVYYHWAKRATGALASTFFGVQAWQCMLALF